MTAPREFVVRYQINAKASVDAMRLAQARLLRWHTVGDTFAIVVGAIGFATGYDWALGIALAGVVLLIESRTSFLQRWIVARRARSVIGQVGEMTIGEEGIDFRMPHASGRIPWSALTGVLADGRSVVFTRDRIISGYIPASAFSSRAEQDEVVAFSRARIAAARPTPARSGPSRA